MTSRVGAVTSRLHPTGHKRGGGVIQRRLLFGCVLSVGLGLALCAASPLPEPSPAGEVWPPELLSETGLYREADAASGRIAAGHRPFAPQYPLWSDGAAKRRWASLPPGQPIDARQPENWVFPVGTRLWKEFSLAGRKVETRYIEKVEAGRWVFASYLWNPEQTVARRAPERGVPNHVTQPSGEGYDIPSVADCKICHEGTGRDSVLGFSALELSSDRDPLAPHAEPVPEGALDLSGLIREGLISPAPTEWLSKPPVVKARTPRERAVLGYLHANCSQCHNDQDPVASVGLHLRAALTATEASAQPTLATALGQKSKFQMPGQPPGECFRLAPGDPARSSLLFRMLSRDQMRQMPPLGTRLVDREATELVAAWIAEELAAPTRDDVGPSRRTGEKRR